MFKGIICLFFILLSMKGYSQQWEIDSPIPLLSQINYWQVDRKAVHGGDIKPDSIYTFYSCDSLENNNLIVTFKGNRMKKRTWSNSFINHQFQISIWEGPGRSIDFLYDNENSFGSEIKFRQKRQKGVPPMYEEIISLTK
jgi:hypothetical protein